MERIVIEVNERTAKKWQEASPESKSRLEKNIEKQIEIISQSDKEAQFEELLNKAREEAAKNGLTEKTLPQLPNEK